MIVKILLLIAVILAIVLVRILSKNEKTRMIVYISSLSILLLITFGEPIVYRMIKYNDLKERRDNTEQMLLQAQKSGNEEKIEEALVEAEKINNEILILTVLNDQNWEWDMNIDDRVKEIKYIEY